MLFEKFYTFIKINCYHFVCLTNLVESCLLIFLTNLVESCLERVVLLFGLLMTESDESLAIGTVGTVATVSATLLYLKQVNRPVKNSSLFSMVYRMPRILFFIIG